VVPRGPAQPRPAALALPLPPGRVPLRPARPPRPRPWRPRAGTARHRRLRRRPLLVGRRHVRQGLPDRRPRAHHRGQPRPGRGDDRRPPHPVVPQHLVLRRRQPPPADPAGRNRTPRRRPPASRIPARRRPGPGRDIAGHAVLRERDQRRASVRVGTHDTVPQGRDQRPRRPRRAHRQPRRGGHEGGVPVSAPRGRRRDGRAAAAAAPAERGRHRS